MSTSRVSALSLYTVHPHTGHTGDNQSWMETLETPYPLRSRRDNRNYCSQFLLSLTARIQIGYNLMKR